MTTPPSLINDCFLHDKDRLRHDEAIALLKERLAPVVGNEEISTQEAVGRILAQDITAPFSPEQKGLVERNIGTLQRGLMTLLPGFIGHSVKDRKQIIL